MIYREESVEFPLPKDVREAWCHWLRRHSIDPAHVSAHGPIEVDTDARTIRFMAYDLDEDGCRHAAPDGKTAAQSTRTMQLTAALAPFPEVLERWLTRPWTDTSP